MWEATFAEADAYLADQRRLGNTAPTRVGKAGAPSGFSDFVIARYEDAVRQPTGALGPAADR